jgi:5-methyltetrahydrofolate--homocysteine methyltransferase
MYLCKKLRVLNPLSQTPLSLEALLNERMLVLDGAMGTMVQQYGLQEADYRGERFRNHPHLLKGCNDVLSITQSELISDIHRKYLHAGADVIETNTFNANRFSLSDYGLEDLAYEINASSARLARIVADEFTRIYPSQPRFVVGSVGPTGKTLSISPDMNDPSFRAVSFDEMAEAYAVQIKGLVDGGVHAVLIETIFDTLNAKAALFAAETVFEQLERRVPLMISVTISDLSGRTLSGQTLKAFFASVSHAPLMSIGMNCALGAREMTPFLRELASFTDLHITAYPNAGLPNADGGYDEKAEEMAAIIRQWAEEGIVRMIGGCCGTTPEHIALLSSIAKETTVKARPKPAPVTILSGLEPLLIGADKVFINIGERTNVAGSRKFARLIAEKKYEEALSVARQQAEAGAHMLDVNLDDGMLDALREMEVFLKMLSTEPDIARLPVMIDSSRWEVIVAGLKCLQGKSVVNSISLKDGEKTFLERARFIRRMGAAVVVMAFDEEGQAVTYSHKIRIAERAFRLLTEEAGFPAEDIIIDLNILTIGTGLEEHRNFALDYIRALEWTRNHLPGVRTSGGISNLSFAFRGHDRIREAMHAVFLFHAIRAGLDMGIVNAGVLPLVDDLDPAFKELLEDLILNRRKDATERLIMFSGKMKDSEASAVNGRQDEWRETTVDVRLQTSLLRGLTDHLEEDLKEALKAYAGPLDIIAGPLMKSMNHIGGLFGSGKMFLPQVVKSARVMKKAVDILMPFIEAEKSDASELANKGVIIMATVKGDVHDIGKNIAGLIMSCNSYKVIDLGVMVPAAAIVDEAVKHRADAVGLSGLITPSLDEMILVARAMEEAGLKIPLLIGGATTSAKHTELKIAPEYSGKVVHVRDAGQAVGILESLLHGSPFEQPAETKSKAVSAESESRQYLSIEQARQAAVRIDWSHYACPIPASEGIFAIHDQPLADLLPLIDWTFFLHAWEIGGRYPLVLKDPVKGDEARKLIQDAEEMLGEIIDRRYLKAKAYFAILPANADSDDVIVYEDDRRISESGKLLFLRNQEAGSHNLCLADYIAPMGYPDHIGLFAVTAGIGAANLASEWAAGGDDYRSFMLLLLADRLAEAFAELLHQKVRTEFWAYDPEESLTTAEILGSKYRGIRPAPGYPACPDHEAKADIFRLLRIPAGGDLSLTQNYMMNPVASICGYYFSHPDSRYFTTGLIGDDQLADYRRRKLSKMNR